MQMVNLIEKKRDGIELSAAEIGWFIRQVTDNKLPDYQTAALLMAIYFQGMTPAETVALTLAMAASGHQMDLSAITDYAIDKHSSGGVGDKTTLIVLPLVASLGVRVAKMSGRGLGFSGGTLDKLESIAGFNVNLSEDEFRRIAQQVGVVLCGQTGELAPADGKLYALRDVTGTVASIPLIASSIMSKKLASGARGIVLDVKLGNGAFMDTLDRARDLAQTMVQIGVDAQRDVVALLSDMNQPLGFAVGNALEVREAVACLSGGGPADLREHCLYVAQVMLRLSGRGQAFNDGQETRRQLETQLSNGAALAKFRQMVEAQGGDVRMIDDPMRLPQARFIMELRSDTTGHIAEVNALQIAQAALGLGAGRTQKNDPIDPAVGVEVLVKVGDHVTAGQTVGIVYANQDVQGQQAVRQVYHALRYSDTLVAPLPLFYGELEGMARSAV